MTMCGATVSAAPDHPRARLRPPTIRLFPALAGPARQSGQAADARGRVYLPMPHVAEAFGVPLSADGPLAALIDVAYHGPGPSAWRHLGGPPLEAALLRSYLPDGLIDAPPSTPASTRATPAATAGG